MLQSIAANSAHIQAENVQNVQKCVFGKKKNPENLFMDKELHLKDDLFDFSQVWSVKRLTYLRQNSLGEFSQF